jgi:hypothetical protein
VHKGKTELKLRLIFKPLLLEETDRNPATEPTPEYRNRYFSGKVKFALRGICPYPTILGACAGGSRMLLARRGGGGGGTLAGRPPTGGAGGGGMLPTPRGDGGAVAEGAGSGGMLPAGRGGDGDDGTLAGRPPVGDAGNGGVDTDRGVCVGGGSP